MEKACDLHTHSIFSDGTYTPTELILEGEKIGLAAIALTDHNTVAGVPEFLSAAVGKSILPIPGVEITTEYKGTEVHILGLFLPQNSLCEVTGWVEEYNRQRGQCNEELIARLQEAGYAVDYGELQAKTPEGHLNRVHIAADLVEKGYIADIQEGFRTILSEKNGFYRPPKRLDALETVAFLRNIGAKPVWAHPFLQMDEMGVRNFLYDAKPRGLVGMETVYSRYTKQTTKRARRIAKEFAVKESGGSDFHGEKRTGIALGKGEGNLWIPAAFYQNLQR